MILNIVSGKSREKMPPLFTVSGGTYLYDEKVATNGTVNWELALLSGSGATVTFQRVVDKVDVFLCGGGAPGQGAATGSYRYGGAGGEAVTHKNVSVSAGTAYPFTVGGSNAASSIFGKTAAAGGGSAGGRGADASSTAKAKNGTDGTKYAFDAASTLLYAGRLYGGGGGGGGDVLGGNSYNGGAGGANGGGHGADRSHTAAASAAGAANTGGGGGGGCYDAPYNISYNPGAGGSGIIIIRNARG